MSERRTSALAVVMSARTPARSKTSAANCFVLSPRPLATLYASPDRPRAASARYASTTSATCRRSEEHTSELQSLAYLVCRLLLDKKNYNIFRTLSLEKADYSTQNASTSC